MKKSSWWSWRHNKIAQKNKMTDEIIWRRKQDGEKTRWRRKQDGEKNKIDYKDFGEKRDGGENKKAGKCWRV